MSKPYRQGDESDNLPQASRPTIGGRGRRQRRSSVTERLLSPDEKIAGRYRILTFIAAGGMGEVYAAFDEALNAKIALKTLVPDLVEQKHVERFRNEIQLARQVTHPNVCRIFDLGQHTFVDGDPRAREPLLFLTMELVEGPTLLQRISEGRLGLEEARRIVEQMARALDAAHESGVIHRDFKSSNVLLRVAGGESRGLRAVVTDFGLALPENADQGDADTALGTPEYMAPEQLRGLPLTPACDLYALGIVMFEMVTGQLPFPSDDPFARLDRPPPSPRALRPDLPERWEQTILRCLAQSPRERFTSALDVVSALAEPRPKPRAPIFWAAGVALLLVLATVGALAIARLRHRVEPKAVVVSETGESVAPRPVLPKKRRTVAVLGFKNSSGRAEVAWLSTALGEMLANEIAAGADVRVIPPDTVARVKLEMGLRDGDAVTVTALHRLRDRIGADLVADGAYLVIGPKDGARVRLDLRLQETNAGETVAAASDQARETELFELVSRAGDKLRVGLGAEKLPEREAGSVRAALPNNPEAARLYAEGLAELRRFDALAARQRFEKAAAIEPGHAFVHSALSSAWSALGYDKNAQLEAKRAFDLSAKLSRADRLTIEARYRETLPDWNEAIRIYRALFSFFPDDLQYGLQLARSETLSGHGKDALATLASLRLLPPPAGEDPSIDLSEAEAAETLSDFKRELAAADAATKKGQALGARLIVERARISEGAARWGLADAKGALAAYAESKRLALAGGDRDSVARALQMLGNTHAMQSDAAAKKEFEESLLIYREIGDRRGEAGALSGMATIVSDDDPTRACVLYEQALAIDRLIGDKRRIAVELNNLAVSYDQLGRLNDAGKNFREAASVFRDAGYNSAAGSALSNLASNLLNHGDVDGARDTAEEALQVVRPSDSQPDIAWANAVLATVLRQADDLEGARRRLEQAIAIARKLAQASDVAGYEALEAAVALDQGHPADAERLARAASEHALAAQSGVNEAAAWATLAEALLAEGKLGDAKSALARAQKAQPPTGVDPDHVLALTLAAARVQSAAGERAAAIASLRAALVKATAAGYVLHQIELRVALAEIDPAADVQQVVADARARGLLRLAHRAGDIAQRR